MGRWRSKNKKKRLTKGGKSGVFDQDKDQKETKDDEIRQSWLSVVKENVRLEEYYKRIIPASEWTVFSETIRQPLPSSFRITTVSSGEANIIRKLILSDEFAQLRCGESDTSLAIQPLEWYPKKLAFQFNVSRLDIKKNPELQKLFDFLQSESQCGYLTRQEAVSMIPPLVLDVRPGMKVLDMCAAPGSKTSQLVEMLQDPLFHDPSDPHPSRETISEGVLVANDVDNHRCYTLVHQIKRLQSPHCIVINHDASLLPHILKKNETQVGYTFQKYDRILADVPCSGDGTIRKNYSVWTRWNPVNSYSLHGLQYRILRRGVELLAKDGMLVYSTCSLNPVEDEAVVSGILNESAGVLELVDASDRVPGLKFQRGLSKWILSDRDNQPIESFDSVPENLKSVLTRRMFAPDNADSLHLNRCIRVYPHHQNTGGFFVALIRKNTDKMPWESTKERSVKEDNEKVHPKAEDSTIDDEKKDEKDAISEPPAKKPRWIKGEEPFIMMGDPIADKEPAESLLEWKTIKDYFGITDEFPPNQLFHRGARGKKRTVYFLSAAATRVVSENRHRLKMINAGVRLFCRAEAIKFGSPFRVTQEGITELATFIPKDKMIPINHDDLVLMLTNMNVPNEKFSAQFQTATSDTANGSFVMIYRQETTDEHGNRQELVIPFAGWRGASTMRAYVSEDDKAHYYRMVTLDLGPMPKNKPESPSLDVEDTLKEKANIDESAALI